MLARRRAKLSVLCRSAVKAASFFLSSDSCARLRNISGLLLVLARGGRWVDLADSRRAARAFCHQEQCVHGFGTVLAASLSLSAGAQCRGVRRLFESCHTRTSLGASRRTFTPFAHPPSLYLDRDHDRDTRRPPSPFLYLEIRATWTGGCAPWAARRPGTTERASRSRPIPYTTTREGADRTLGASLELGTSGWRSGVDFHPLNFFGLTTLPLTTSELFGSSQTAGPNS